MNVSQSKPEGKDSLARANGRPRIEATYDYRTADGELLFQAVRFWPKDFRQRRPDGRGSWVYNLQGVPRVLYRLPELLGAPKDQLVFIVEGEKDADRLRSFGWVATCNPMGAGKWRPEFNEALRGRHVFVLADNDDAGHKHARDVERNLRGFAASVAVVELPGLGDHGDVSDWLGANDNDQVLLLKTIEEVAKRQRNEPDKREPPDQKPEKAAPVPVLRQLSEVQALPVSWLWRHRIPRGALTLLDGDPGLGKSTITVDLAARVSRGWRMPPEGGPCEGTKPEGVLLLSAEDDPERTIRPRLDAAEADVSRTHILDAVRVGDEERPPVLPWDLELLESFILDHEIALVVIDPFLGFLDGELDAHKDQDVRRCLHRLKQIAGRTQAAILLIRHLNKLNHSVALYRGGGSIGIVGAARSGLVVGRDPNDARTKVLASVKSNLGPAPKSLTYALETTGDVSRIAWGKESDLDANDILAHPAAKGKKSAGQQCAEAVRELLINGPMPSDELEDRLATMGYTKYAVKEARRVLKVRAIKHGLTGHWMAEMPGPAGDEEVEEVEVRPNTEYFDFFGDS